MTFTIGVYLDRLSAGFVISDRFAVETGKGVPTDALGHSAKVTQTDYVKVFGNSDSTALCGVSGDVGLVDAFKGFAAGARGYEGVLKAYLRARYDGGTQKSLHALVVAADGRFSAYAGIPLWNLTMVRMGPGGVVLTPGLDRPAKKFQDVLGREYSMAAIGCGTEHLDEDEMPYNDGHFHSGSLAYAVPSVIEIARRAQERCTAVGGGLNVGFVHAGGIEIVRGSEAEKYAIELERILRAIRP